MYFSDDHLAGPFCNSVVEDQTCAKQFTTGKSGSIPLQYDNNRHCIWNVEPQCDIVEWNVEHFNIEECGGH